MRAGRVGRLYLAILSRFSNVEYFYTLAICGVHPKPSCAIKYLILLS